MGRARVREHADVRAGEEAELADLAARAHAHLQDQHLVLGREPRERQRNSDVVVQIPPILVDAEARSQHRRDHLLGGGLSVRAGHRGDRDARARPAMPAQSLERAERVLDLDHGLPRVLPRGIGRPRRGGERPSGHSVERRRDELVAVHVRSRERHEELAPLQRARVDGAGAEGRHALRIDRKRETPFGHAEDFRQREPGTILVPQRPNPFR